MGEETTGTKNKNYNLISVAYHAEHGAWNYQQYVQDAENNGDDELADFFREVQKTYADIGSRAQSLLKDRVG